MLSIDSAPTSEKLELVFVLDDGAKIVKLMEQAGDAAQRAAIATFHQRQEAEKLCYTLARQLVIQKQMQQAGMVRVAGGPGSGSGGSGGMVPQAPLAYYVPQNNTPPGGQLIPMPPGVPSPSQYKNGFPRFAPRTQPDQRADQVRAAYQQFLAGGGDPHSSFGRDLKLTANRAQQHVDKIDESAIGGTWQQRLAKAFMSSRVGIGNAYPLVNQVASVAGVNTAQLTKLISNPYVLAAMAALSLAKVLYDLTEKAAAVGTAFSNLKVMSGGSSAEAANLSALGISGDRSRALSDRIAQDPVAAMYARRFGAVSIPGPFGTIDNAANTLKIVKGLRTLSGPEQQRAMHVLGTEDLAPLLKVSNETMDKLQQDAKISGSLMDPEFEKQVAEYNVAKKRMTDSFGTLWVSLTQGPMKNLTDLFNNIAEANNSLANLFGGKDDSHAILGKPNSPMSYPVVGKTGSGDGGTLKAPATYGTPEYYAEQRGGAQSEIDHNTNALESNTKAVAMLTRRLGGGDRTDRALPSYLTGPKARGAALIGAQQMGALRLGGI